MSPVAAVLPVRKWQRENQWRPEITSSLRPHYYSHLHESSSFFLSEHTKDERLLEAGQHSENYGRSWKLESQTDWWARYTTIPATFSTGTRPHRKSTASNHFRYHWATPIFNTTLGPKTVNFLTKKDSRSDELHSALEIDRLSENNWIYPIHLGFTTTSCANNLLAMGK